MTNTPTTRAKITERDATYLAFLAKFPAADAEALSYLTTRSANPFGATEGELNNPAGITKRFQKLVNMGAASKFRNPITGQTHYALTALGHEASIFYGYEIPPYKPTKSMSISRLEHYRHIALVAAQMVSPVPQFKEALGISEPFGFEALVGEDAMRTAFDPVHKLLAKAEVPTDFGTYRKQLGKRIQEEVKAGHFEIVDVLGCYPQLWTLGAPSTLPGTKTIHQPDFALNLDESRTGKGKNVLVEVELSAKTPGEYEDILRTFKHEFSTGLTYACAIYFVNSKHVAQAIKRADSKAGTNLTGDGRLRIVPIHGRDNKQKTPTNRLIVPQGASGKVSEDVASRIEIG